MKRYIDERLPEEYEKCLVGLNAITKEAWNTTQNTEDNREKIQALSLAKECHSMKLDLLTSEDNREKLQAMELFKDTHLVKLELLSNATTIDSALHYIRNKQQQQERAKELAIDSAVTTTNQVF